MRWAVPASVAVHVGLIAGAWLFMQSQPEDLSAAEAAVSIDIISTEEAVTEPSDTVSEASANLVSSGTTQASQEASEAETVETAAVEPVEVTEAQAQPAQPVVAAAVPVTETVVPAETEELVSATVMTAASAVETPIAAPIPQVASDVAPVVADTVAPSDAMVLERLDQSARLTELQASPDAQELTTASISPVTPATPVASPKPVEVANLDPVIEPLEEIAETPPVPKPRIARKPVEAEEKPAEKPVEKKKPTEKPVEKKQAKQVASLGNGGEAEADSAAAKAAGGAKGKVVTAGKGAISAYEGKVRAKFLKAVRKPRDSNRGDVRVLFMLDANGRVVKSQLSRSSGDDKLDRAALAAVERAAPYPPIPEGSGKSTWVFTVPVSIN